MCGYANTDGGILHIGVNDDGYVVGIKDSKSLLESLPNKINDKLGIIASINSLSDKGSGKCSLWKLCSRRYIRKANEPICLRKTKF